MATLVIGTGVGADDWLSAPCSGACAGGQQPRDDDYHSAASGFAVGRQSAAVGGHALGVGTTGKTMPGSTQSDTTQRGQTGSGSVTTGSKTSSITNGHATSGQVKSLQQSLQDKGMDPGRIDGVMGPKTEAAIRAYQKDQNLPQTGRTDAQTLEKLGVQR